MKILLLLVTLLLSLEAIITIAPIQLGEKPGYSGSFEGSFETKRGNTDKDEYTLGLKLLYDNNSSYALWSDVIGTYGEASGQRNTNKTYVHLRLIHTLAGPLNWESFLQSETNEFTNVEKRRLGGLGLRYHFFGSQVGDLFFGVGGFYEKISYSTEIDTREKNTRINTYIAYVKEFDNGHKFTYVAYYQPKIDNFEDYITSHGIEMKFHIVKQFFLKLNLYYDVDSTPALGIEKVDFSQRTILSYEF